ncbi:hypothetical protein, partial [Vibrio parahaemolyticus]
MLMKWILFVVFIGIFVATAIVTILGLIQKVNIKNGYLKGLFSALIIEVIGVVIALSQTTNLMSDPLAEYVAKMPQEVQVLSANQQIEYIRKLSLRPKQCVDCDMKIENLLDILPKGIPGRTPEDILISAGLSVANGNKAQENLLVCSNKLNQCLIKSDDLMTKIAVLSSHIQKYGSTVNFKYDSGSKDKQEIAFLTLEVLGELGYFHGKAEANPLLAHKLLVKYQISKNIVPTT